MFLMWTLAFFNLASYAQVESINDIPHGQAAAESPSSLSGISPSTADNGIHNGSVGTVSSSTTTNTGVQNTTDIDEDNIMMPNNMSAAHGKMLHKWKGKKTCPRFSKVNLYERMLLWTYEECADVMSKCYVEITHNKTFQLSTGCANGEYGNVEECEDFLPNTTSHCVHRRTLRNTVYTGSYCCTRSAHHIYETFVYQLFFMLFSDGVMIEDAGYFFQDTSALINTLTTGGFEPGNYKFSLDPSFTDYLITGIVFVVCLVIGGATIFVAKKYQTTPEGYEPAAIVVEQNNAEQ